MQVNDMLEYMDKIIDAFKNGTFLSEYLKKSVDAGYKYVLKDVKKFTQEIENKEFVEEIKGRMSDLKEGIEKMSKTEKRFKMLMRY